ncbi:hypothetical protein D3H55_12255 [Bacillus salacetis]|uniref:Uncharacterized protein n=1 Tax=Bacillus salacetis TaxID=2315464 RepID=A0A3A1QX30_9BACI|nr:hypothetical protein D3H55_12255 [Bacillus salacetis]
MLKWGGKHLPTLSNSRLNPQNGMDFSTYPSAILMLHQFIAESPNYSISITSLGRNTPNKQKSLNPEGSPDSGFKAYINY